MKTGSPKSCNLAKNHVCMNDPSTFLSIPSPVTFNPYKHHLKFLQDQVKEWRKISWDKAEGDLRCIGNNLIDLYCGNLSVDIICRECIACARKQDIHTAEKLAAWIHPLKYRKITLSDTSVWVLKTGNEADRFLHVHPAKYSPHTIRIRAGTLKTVLAVKITTGIGASGLTLQAVNRIRTEKLGLSPVKMLEKGKGIARMWSCFHNIS